VPFRPTRRAALLAAVAFVSLLHPAAAHAFPSAAAAALARSLSDALPPAARWEPAWDDRAAAAVGAALQSEATDPEHAMARHRFASGTPREALADEAWSGVTGWSPLALDQAATRLAAALAANDPGGAADAIGAVAIACTDLADPYLTTDPAPDEPFGARATFCDLVCDTDLAGLVAADAVGGSDVISVGVALAAESASRRPVVEQAYAAGDASALAALRRERLTAALALGRAVVRSAWARSTAVGLTAPAAGAVAVWPSPARIRADLSFTLARAGKVNVDVFDATGRRVMARGAAMSAGPQRFALDAGVGALPAGVYLVRVTAEGFAGVARLVHVTP
jgi:hypothetical protein